MYVHAVVSTAFCVSLSILLTLGSKGRALADSACIVQPDRDALQGEHWYYHFDREKNRKCWHLGPVAAVVHELPQPPRTDRVRSAGATLDSVFGPLFRGIQNLLRQPMPHEAAEGEPRIVQSDATKPLTIDDIAQPPTEFPEERAEARPASSLTAAQRKALFGEYLKWEELQRATGNAAPARSRQLSSPP
jgi:hypothetical protein